MQLIGTSLHIEDVRTRCARYGPWRRSVVICGETGTGKYVVARELHRCSRRKGAFVRIGASEVRAGGFEQSLLAGKADDAYTGSRRASEGLLRFAAGGTVFLDDLQDLAAEVQSYLLDVIENKPLRASGELRSFETDVRWLFGSQEPLERLVAAGRLKRDLAARMGQVCIALRPLREHLDDVAPLAGWLLDRIAAAEQVERPDLSGRALALLERHPWPDNVRELEGALWEAVIESAVEGCRLIEVRHLPQRIQGLADSSGSRRRVSLEQLLDTLDGTGWVAAEAARRLGVERRTVFRVLKQHGVARPTRPAGSERSAEA